MNRSCIVSALAILSLSAGSAATLPADNAWEPYRFLVGEWTGEGDGEPGKGSGQLPEPATQKRE